MNYRCTIFNPQTQERRAGRLVSSEPAGTPVVLIDDAPRPAGRDGFFGLAVDIPLIRHDDTATVSPHPDGTRILLALGKTFGAPDNDARWELYTYHAPEAE